MADPDPGVLSGAVKKPGKRASWTLLAERSGGRVRLELTQTLLDKSCCSLSVPQACGRWGGAQRAGHRPGQRAQRPGCGRAWQISAQPVKVLAGEECEDQHSASQLGFTGVRKLQADN